MPLLVITLTYVETVFQEAIEFVSHFKQMGVIMNSCKTESWCAIAGCSYFLIIETLSHHFLSI